MFSRRLPTWIDPVILLSASLLCALILWWPLLTIDPEAATVDADGALALEPPPSWMLPLDDAYIFIRFAQQLSRGRPFEWNDDEPSSGATSFVYPFLLLPGQWLFDDLAGWSRWSSWMGVVGLWLLALAGHRVLKSVGLTTPWPLVGGLVLITWGPVAFVSIAGMDTALGCAAVLYAVALWTELTLDRAEPTPSRAACKRTLLLATIAVLPLLRPDFAVLVVLAAGAILLRLGPRLERWTAALIFVPGLALAICYRLLTGTMSPSGAVAKSALSSPFMSPDHVLLVLWNLAEDNIIRAYAGLSPEILPPGVGLVVVGTAVVVLLRTRKPGSDVGDTRASSINWRALMPLTACWLTLVAIAPLSGYLSWQMMRHHHPGLVCAWLLALVGLAAGGRAVLELVARRGVRGRPSQRWSLALFLLPLVLLSRWVDLSLEYFVSAVDLHQAHGEVSRSLDATNRDEVLLVHDAGLLALAHDGPMIDVIGLGTPSFARPYRHGMGAVVEALARRPALPSLAAVRFDLFPVASLLGPVLREGASPFSEEPARLYRFAAQNLHHTRLEASGIDLAHLPSERLAELRFEPPPWPRESSFAITLRGKDGEPQTQGCRPVRGRLRVTCPEASCSSRLQLTAQPGMAGRLRFSGGDADGPRGATRMETELSASSTDWTWVELELTSGPYLWVENVGSGAPCLESIAWGR